MTEGDSRGADSVLRAYSKASQAFQKCFRAGDLSKLPEATVRALFEASIEMLGARKDLLRARMGFSLIVRLGDHPHAGTAFSEYITQARGRLSAMDREAPGD
jgi:hypothetical protein